MRQQLIEAISYPALMVRQLVEAGNYPHNSLYEAIVVSAGEMMTQ